eukprot:s4025_g10.t1
MKFPVQDRRQNVSASILRSVCRWGSSPSTVALPVPQATDPMSAGAVGEASDATPEVKQMCENLRAAAQEKAQAAGWNGLFTEFTALKVSKQVVAGTNYFVKVKGRTSPCRTLACLPRCTPCSWTRLRLTRWTTSEGALP